MLDTVSGRADSAGIFVNRLRKTFRGGGVVACDDVTLDLPDGELLVLLGPSGCGKTTTLRCIAGLERPDNEDAIWVRGRNLAGIAPKDRNLAYVFQATALFPHLSVRRNISFGLDMKRKLPRAEIDRRVADAARLLHIDELLDRQPRELSGGQGQRVALGRAVVMEPDAFLLDEPFAALDAALRFEMRTEIKLIQRRLQTTMIFVTHDQEEALTLGDKIAVMNEGVVQQLASPEEIYNSPANLFVATFIGSPQINLLSGMLTSEGGAPAFASNGLTIPLPDTVAQRLPADGITMGVRPEAVDLNPLSTAATGTVALVELLGSQSLVLLRAGDLELRGLVQGQPDYGEGADVAIGIDPTKALFFGPDGSRIALD